MKVFSLFVCVLMVLGCVVKKPLPDPGTAARSSAFNESRRAGDREFAKMYWAGWHNAACHYEKALKIRNKQQVRQNLFYALLLLSQRDLWFGRINREALDRAAALWPDPLPEPMLSWLAVTRDVLENRFAAAKYMHPHPPEYAKFLRRLDCLQDKLDTDYRLFLFIKALGPHVRDEARLNTVEAVLRRIKKEFPVSNLNVDFRMDPDKAAKQLETFPDFVEIKLGLAEKTYKKGDFLKAEGLYRDVLAIHPQAPAAHTGLGSIRFWLELYDEAVPFYDAALAAEPTFVKALFGKAVSLHQLEKYKASNALFQSMLESQERHHGEAHYYLAVNAYRLDCGEEKVMRHLAAADKCIPDSVELNVFAGIFHFQHSRTDKSRERFKRVLKRKPQHGDARYYLGMINLKQKRYNQALEHFGIAADAFLGEIVNLERRLERVNTLRISERQKNQSRNRLGKRIEKTADERLKALEGILRAYDRSTHEVMRNIRGICSRLRLRVPSRP